MWGESRDMSEVRPERVGVGGLPIPLVVLSVVGMHSTPDFAPSSSEEAVGFLVHFVSYCP